MLITTKNPRISKIWIFPIIAVFLFSNGSYAIVSENQTQTRTNDNDSIKVLYYKDLSWIYRINQPDSALFYANKVKTLSEKINFNKGIAISFNLIGEIERTRGNNDLAAKNFIKALELEKRNNNRIGIAYSYKHLSLVYKAMGNTNGAIAAGQSSIDCYRELHDSSELAFAYDRQAALYESQGRIDEALSLTYSSLELCNKLNDSTHFVYAYMNLANLYLTQLNYNKSLEYNNKAIEIAIRHRDSTNLANIYINTGIVYYHLNQLNTAIEFNLKSIDIKKKLNKEKTIDSNYDNLGIYYCDLGEYDKSLFYYNKCLEIKEKYGKKENLSTVYTNIGNLYLAKKQYDKAISYYQKGLEHAQVNYEKLTILELYHNIYRSYSAIGQLENAVSFNNKYITLRDSIDATYRNAISLKDAYLEEQKKNLLLEKDKLINDAKLKRRNILIFSLSGGMTLLALLFFAIFRSYRLKQRTLIAEKNYEINEQKISELLKNQELNSISAMLEGQEGERKRIAQDLHDRLGSMLSMVKLHFKTVEDNIQALRESNLTIYNKANNLLDEACEEVRKIANDLNSGVLNKFGLVPALRNLQESIRATGQLNIEVLDFGFDDNRLEYNIEINLYRIIQELISNILKHSKASDVTIQLLKKEKYLNIVVEDNGIGFDIDQIKNKKGMGLRNIESRVNSMNGELSIDSGKGAGTTITINIPLE